MSRKRADMVPVRRKKLVGGVNVRDPLVIAAGAGVALFGGIAAYMYFKKNGVSLPGISGSGDDIIIYTSEGEDSGEFRTTATRIAGRTGATVYPFRNAQDILDALHRHPRIKNVLFVGHGTHTQAMRPSHTGIRIGADDLPTWISPQTLGRELSQRMVRGGVIGWGVCSSIGDLRNYDWRPEAFGPGGVGSLTELVRDAMVQAGGFSGGIEHRGHSVTGHVTANPSGRICPVSRAAMGQPCRSVLEDTWGRDTYRARYHDWINAFQGLPAETWIAGGPVTVSSS
jgi:hypothetical protein